MADMRSFTVTDEDDGIRLDRWFKRNMPDVSFNLVSRWARTGQLRLDGKRATPGDRIELTEVALEPAGDAAIDYPAAAEWQEVAREDHPADEAGRPAYSFVTFTRRMD